MLIGFPALPTSLNYANELLQRTQTAAPLPCIDHEPVAEQKKPTNLREFLATLSPRERQVYYQAQHKMTLEEHSPETKAVLKKVRDFLIEHPSHRPGPKLLLPSLTL